MPDPISYGPCRDCGGSHGSREAHNGPAADHATVEDVADRAAARAARAEPGEPRPWPDVKRELGLGGDDA